MLVDVTVVFKKEGDKSENSGAMVAVDPCGEALIGSGEDGCCVSSRDSCPGHSGYGVVHVMGMRQDVAAPSSTAIHDGGMVQRCGWVNNLSVVMEWRWIASCVDVVLKKTVG